MTLILTSINALKLTADLVKSDICYTNNHKSTIDQFLTNKPRSFQFTSLTETALSDYHWQKQPSEGVLRKRCSENMKQIYRRTPMPKCGFNKVVKQSSCKFAAYFQNTFS